MGGLNAFCSFEDSLIPVIDYDALEMHDLEALSHLGKTIEAYGVFYLNLQSTLGERLLASAGEIFGCARELFIQPLDTKNKFDIDSVGPYKLDGSVHVCSK